MVKVPYAIAPRVGIRRVAVNGIALGPMFVIRLGCKYLDSLLAHRIGHSNDASCIHCDVLFAIRGKEGSAKARPKARKGPHPMGLLVCTPLFILGFREFHRGLPVGRHDFLPKGHYVWVQVAYHELVGVDVLCDAGHAYKGGSEGLYAICVDVFLDNGGKLFAYSLFTTHVMCHCIGFNVIWILRKNRHLENSKSKNKKNKKIKN